MKGPPTNSFRFAAGPYLIAVLATALVVVLRFALSSVLGEDTPMLLFVVAVMAAAWAGGLKPGLLATALSVAAGVYFFIERDGLHLPSPIYQVRLLMFVFVGLLVSLLSESMHSNRRQAEARREALRVTLASIGDAVIATDLRGQVTFLNPVAESLTGWKEVEAAGKPMEQVFRIVNETTRQPVENPAARALREGAIVGLANHTILIAKDGAEWPIDDSAAPIRDEQGRVSGCVLIFRDVSQQRQSVRNLAESEERCRTLADNISQFAWTADAKGWIYWYNQRWYDYTGTTLEEMQGWGWKKVHHPDHVDRVVARLQRSWDSGEAWEDTFPLRGVDGKYRWFLSRALPIRNPQGEVVRWFGTNTDVTEQRRMAEELRKFAAEMSEADRRKNEFLAMLAHELRNPLAPIRNALQIMRLTGGNGEDLDSASTMMERQVGQMVRLVDDLLDVSRITRGKIELRTARIELASAVNHALEAARALVQCADQKLTVTLPTEPIYVNADHARLAQVVGNLLNNACKFTDRGGHIWLTVERDVASRSRERPEAVIRVRDTGIGIAPEQLPRIFDMFMQVDTSIERSVSGLGIGLTMVKNLVEMHGGTVEVRSAGLGQGSEFTVRLPIAAEAPAAAPGPTIAPPTPATGRRILVVDDNRDSVTSLAMLLKLSGHQTHTAFDGAEAVEAAAKLNPEVVLLDIGLPKLNGYEVARKIRQQPWGDGMVLVALTGWGQEEDRRKSHEAGFDGHLVKPVDHAELAAMLAELLPG